MNIEQLKQEWETRIREDYSQETSPNRESILAWLLGQNYQRFDSLNETQKQIFYKGIDFLYRTFQKRYFGVSPELAYKNLIGRLGGLVMVRQKIRLWLSQSRDRHQTVIEVLQEVIQEMLNSDRYLQEQLNYIATCTKESRLRNSFLLANLEEYCLRPIRNQPLFVYRFFNYLKRIERGGLTQIPQGDWIKLISEDVLSENSEEILSLWDNQALIRYQETQVWEEQQLLREQVKKELIDYLEKELEPLAAQWLNLYLQGKSQDEIAKILELPVKQLYRLREKVSYHAIRVFALKQSPELVANWLEISLKEHHLGLTPSQWTEYWSNLTPEQRYLIDRLKNGKSINEIAQELHQKNQQVLSEWTKLYLAAQSLRNQ